MGDIFIPSIAQDKLHPKVKLLMSDKQFMGHRKILNEWARIFDDKDGKFLKEFQTTFHSSFWELYLSTVFKYMGFKCSLELQSPDFIVNYPKRINVEAVIANIKSGGRSERDRNHMDFLKMSQPFFKDPEYDMYMCEAITRYSNSIGFKSNKYLKDYCRTTESMIKEPFVIALASFDQIEYGREFIFPMSALLYGEYYDSKSKKFLSRFSITKPGTTSEIPIGIFNDEKYKHVSAIIFTCTLTIGKLTALALSLDFYSKYPNSVINTKYRPEKEPHFVCQVITGDNHETLTDGLFVFHNPNAENQLSPDMFDFEDITQVRYNAEERNVLLSSNDYPLVSRIDFPTFSNEIIIEDKLHEILSNYND